MRRTGRLAGMLGAALLVAACSGDGSPAGLGNGGSGGGGGGGGAGLPNLGPGASLNGKRPFPDDNSWNADVSGSPVDPNSATLINSCGGLDRRLHADFGTVWNGAPNGIPYVVVAGSQAKVPVSFEYDDESDPGPYPVPSTRPSRAGRTGAATATCW